MKNIAQKFGAKNDSIFLLSPISHGRYSSRTFTISSFADDDDDRLVGSETTVYSDSLSIHYPPPFLMHLITYCIFYCIKQMPVQYRETKYIFFIVIKSTLNGGKR